MKTDLVSVGVVLCLTLLVVLLYTLFRWVAHAVEHFSEEHETAFALLAGVIGWGIIVGFLSCVIYFFSFRWLPTH